MFQVTLYTDGSCIGNPGPGGYAAILQCNGRAKEITGSSDHTTNNRMELQAVIAGLRALKHRCQVTVVTDSQYVVTILNNGRAKANLDLVQQVRQLTRQHDITVQQVRGHSGHEMNEQCDRLATAVARQRCQTRERGLMWRIKCGIINFKQYGSIPALNQAFDDHWVYIGRANNYAGLPQSPLANPFKVKDFGGRGKTLPHYRRWLWERIQAGDTAVLDALKAIDAHTVLVCWCKPGPCHGDVVKVAVAWVQAQCQQTAFVSGHRDLTPAEFYQHYQPQLDKAIAAGHRFVVGDAPGADAMVQMYLTDRVAPERVTVYHARRKPRYWYSGFAVRGGYTNQSAKDAAMTAVSDYDIAWVRQGKETSGTALNLARRR